MDLEILQGLRDRGRLRIIGTDRTGRPIKIFNNNQDRRENDDAIKTEELDLENNDDNSEFDQPQNEQEVLNKNDTWTMADRPNEKNIIGSRTVLQYKYNGKGESLKRKARVVAQGFSQRPGVDYNNTFAPVARLSSIRLLLALAVKYDLFIQQLDITMAHLHETIDEEIFMEKPKLLKESLKKSFNIMELPVRFEIEQLIY